ncbi:DUF2283 domain-containing protein [Leptospira bourretii]|uniref:DUF2283 domain-containing protein n=1 Tax=Leptospira bourretii TaxID=2484962 RepID=A0A4R9ISN1_9LEPT|nr:DUF2283 domain-containing protein [Leptospira bourretii]TGK85586.1 DUF2283 domain-containing protein [Leptospira bourretii]TGK94482.1 DUF2283 domain-containing protein [Leptospira bourretii]TGL24839.1 DUF2283 domain-containing protein [Leptospira bourretii]TGL33201.1 DUF2283 domain-containing protein [Leptospira bourretii]
MKITHYQETDSIYIDLAEKTSFETKEITKDINIDLDEQGNLVGIDIHGNASKFVDLSGIALEKC